MQFVLPFTKSRLQSGNLPVENEQIVGDDESIVDEPVENSITPTLDSQVQQPSEQLNESSEGPSHRLSSSGRSSLKRKRTTVPSPCDVMENAVVSYLSQKSSEKSENPDLDFFRSIIPDLSTFTPSQKRRFKLKILQILEDMSNEGSRPSSNYTENLSDLSSHTSSSYLPNITHDMENQSKNRNTTSGETVECEYFRL